MFGCIASRRRTRPSRRYFASIANPAASNMLESRFLTAPYFYRAQPPASFGPLMAGADDSQAPDNAVTVVGDPSAHAVGVLNLNDGMGHTITSSALVDNDLDDSGTFDPQVGSSLVSISITHSHNDTIRADGSYGGWSAFAHNSWASSQSPLNWVLANPDNTAVTGNIELNLDINLTPPPNNYNGMYGITTADFIIHSTYMNVHYSFGTNRLVITDPTGPDDPQFGVDPFLPSGTVLVNTTAPVGGYHYTLITPIITTAIFLDYSSQFGTGWGGLAADADGSASFTYSLSMHPYNQT